MLKGFRLLIAAACGVAIFISVGAGAYLGSLYGPEHKQYKTLDINSVRSEDDHGTSKSLPDIAGLPTAVERLIANPAPNVETELEKRDLAAQEATAMLAFWTMVVTATGVIATVLGTGLIFWQIWLARRASDQERETADIQSRPYLIAQDARCRFSEGKFCVNIMVFNHGNTAAVWGEVQYASRIRKIESQKIIVSRNDIPQFDDAGGTPINVIPAGQAIPLEFRDTEKRAALYVPHTRIDFTIHLQFRTVFRTIITQVFNGFAIADFPREIDPYTFSTQEFGAFIVEGIAKERNI